MYPLFVIILKFSIKNKYYAHIIYTLIRRDITKSDIKVRYTMITASSEYFQNLLSKRLIERQPLLKQYNG